MDTSIVRNRVNTMKIKRPILVTVCTASCLAFGSPVFAVDLNGSWATDASVCNKVFVKKGDTVAFAQDSDLSLIHI